MENNNLPEMTDEQRKAALERSAEARRERMEFKELVKKGEISLADALADDRAKRIRVHEFLMCIPASARPRPMTSCASSASRRTAACRVSVADSARESSSLSRS